MRCPESNVRIGKQICVSALALLLYEIPYEYLHQNFDRKRKIISAFGHFYIFLIEKPVLKSKAALIYVFI